MKLNPFAGFWIDGALRRPAEGHANEDGLVYALDKDQKTFRLTGIRPRDVNDGWYWLDRFRRNPLTPEEALAAVQIIYPKVTHIFKDCESWTIDYNDDEVNVNWGILTQYPPGNMDLELVTKDNVKDLLFRPCLMPESNANSNLHAFSGSVDVTTCHHGTVAGWMGSKCLVQTKFNGVLPFKDVLVRKEKTNENE